MTDKNSFSDLNRPARYFKVSMPEPSSKNLVAGPPSSLHKKLRRLCIALNNMDIPNVRSFQIVEAAAGDRWIVLRHESEDSLQAENTILKIVKLIQQAFIVVESNAYQPQGRVTLEELIKSEPLRSLLQVLAQCQAEGMTIIASAGSDSNHELPLPHAAWLVNRREHESYYMAGAEVIGVILGSDDMHVLRLGRSRSVRINMGETTARLLLAKPHAFTGTIINAGSNQTIDTSMPWRLYPIQRRNLKVSDSH